MHTCNCTLATAYTQEQLSTRVRLAHTRTHALATHLFHPLPSLSQQRVVDRGSMSPPGLLDGLVVGAEFRGQRGSANRSPTLGSRSCPGRPGT
eukprot:4883067-Alexandrium_andersonii.AAC.1